MCTNKMGASGESIVMAILGASQELHWLGMVPPHGSCTVESIALMSCEWVLFMCRSALTITVR